MAQNDFEGAKDKVLMGAERKSMILSEKEKLITAYHEAGHALLSKLCKEADPLHKVTIIPRGRALGLTQMLPEEDRYTQSRTYSLDQLCVLFGGRVAEELQFNEITSGASNDLEVATGIVRRMVCEWGMSPKLGAVTFGKKEEAIFLGREMSQRSEYSEQTAQEIDSEVRRIMTEQYDRAKLLLNTNMLALRRVAEVLIQYETIEGAEVQLLLEGKPMTREPPKVRMPTREELDRRYQAEQAKEKEAGRQKPQVLGPLAGTGEA